MDKAMREFDRYKQVNQTPSFSSSLLDQIYRSIDGASETNLEDSRFYRENPMRKQSKISKKSNEREISEQNGRWVDQKITERVIETKTRRFTAEFDRESHCNRPRYHYRHDNDHDSLFFTSTSSSSDSSSCGFSSSDTELMYGKRSTKPSCFAPPRPKPVRTGGSVKPEKTEKKKHNSNSSRQSSLCHETREIRYVDDYCVRSATDYTPKQEENLIKSNTRAMKIYNNLKKVKQPISPGGRLASFINSLFSVANTKKSSIPRYNNDGFLEKSQDSIKSGQVSTCSSASSLSRSCLSKHSPSTREKLRNGVKRSVRFYPVSVIVGEDLKPCGHKNLFPEEKHKDYGNGSHLVSVSVPSEWQIGKPQPRRSYKEDEIVRVQMVEKSRRVEEIAREILREYEKKKHKDVIMRNMGDEHYDHDDDDGMSCSSSELFELDLIGSGRYREELPVYETTHVETNRAIASGLIL